MSGSGSPERKLPVSVSCVTFWDGSELGPVERACMKSVLRQGHELALYCYRQPSGVPEGVEVRDATSIVPGNALFRQNGSIASFSDWLRYELLDRGAGTWIDTDMYLLRPLDGEQPFLFGEEEPGIINNAVLRLPSGSPVLNSLLEIFRNRSAPWWLPWRTRLPLRLRQLIRGTVDLERLPWGATGPLAITALAKRFGIAQAAVPNDIFYPTPWSSANWILDPKISLEGVTTGRTVGIHLWNECIKPFKNSPAPPGSFLERLHEEGGT